ncbi:MAG: SgcJ/EcaC family oxidoreductase [Gemmatimonadales bacterium]|nr:SgcJ/EcaC family oxidoreductase [Gemmatimonadales bacterium]NIN10988.1 SgcJ/EcaC family oxidoreductase [Gemmatimonadales bacterium]NIN49580.1 SgcJ/EcaC family oxidoreductase [Gemmatimonadales bacterium]NIP07044.1 SgcJ/EcaC family oxidoreductase [Gemmatimonadales bacterium]NIR01679.1 SgcJ/EcaC family oxidoreductase [Gemmatimonadales bacterium]
MYRRLFATVTVVAVVAAACQPATTELTEDQKAEIAGTVSAIHAEHRNAWRDADIDRGMSYFHDDPDVQFALEGAVMHGSGTIRDALEPIFEGVASQEITIAESQTVVLAPGVVCVMDQGTFAYVDTAGVTGPETAFAFTAVYVRRGGEWKVLLAHESLPTPESM